MGLKAAIHVYIVFHQLHIHPGLALNMHQKFLKFPELQLLFSLKNNFWGKHWATWRSVVLTMTASGPMFSPKVISWKLSWSEQLWYASSRCLLSKWFMIVHQVNWLTCLVQDQSTPGSHPCCWLECVGTFQSFSPSELLEICSNLAYQTIW